jgi:general secretion pathway protein H
MRTSAPGSRAVAPDRRAASGGFTLIELMVVVMLAAVAAGVASLALRDGTQDRLEREATRLAALLETARAEARAAALPVVWRPTPEAAGQPFRFLGLPPSRAMPTRWLDDAVQAQVEGERGALVLGPEPLIGAQRVRLSLEGHRVIVGTDGLRPFALLAADEPAR